MKAIVFDMDGVLFDTEQVYFRAWDIEGKTFGMTPDEVREIRLRCAGHNPADTRVLFNEYFKGRVDFDAFWKKKVERTRQLLREEKIRVKPGLYELLDYLSKNGWAVALATSTNREGTLFNLDQTGITDAFQVLVTGDLFVHGKPDPEIYLRACELLGSRPEETFAVEDSYAGLESARRAGMRVVMIPDLFPPTEETARNADYTLGSLADLQRLLQEEENR